MPRTRVLIRLVVALAIAGFAPVARVDAVAGVPSRLVHQFCGVQSIDAGGLPTAVAAARMGASAHAASRVPQLHAAVLPADDDVPRSGSASSRLDRFASLRASLFRSSLFGRAPPLVI